MISATVTGPCSWPKVIGPAHLSLPDRGLTFATNPERGVCITFDAPVPGLDPFGALRHPDLTVTVERPAELADLLDPSGHDEGSLEGAVSGLGEAAGGERSEHDDDQR